MMTERSVSLIALNSISQALLDKNNSFMMWTSEDWDRLFAGLGIRPKNLIGWGRW
jgi:hypothetical protein